MNRPLLVAALAVLLLAVVPFAGYGAAATPPRHYPAAGDHFGYTEEITVTNGLGDYTGYTEASFINGTIGITGIAPNNTASATYSSTTAYRNSTGANEMWTSSGAFTFSATTFHYVQGTDNQTGYTDPYVWFYIDNTLPNGSSFFLLNSGMNVVTTQGTYRSALSSTGYLRAIEGQGTGSYQRDDSYGMFTASYTWTAYFDPGTGYIVGYVYTEQDRDGSGNGFTYTDILAATSTSFPITVASAPPSSGSGSSGPALSSFLYIALIGLVVLVIIVVIIYAVVRSRRAPSLPRHSAGGTVGYGYAPPPPPGAPPPPIQLTPQGQPAVQQVVLREKVMVNCRYCGALMDPEATNCPKCGAPRG